MPRAHHVFLVPGFFGFLSLGELTYFSRVTGLLREQLAVLGVEARVHALGTLPTGSLPSRAASLAAAVAQMAPSNAPLHFVGHSSGGLDVRLMLSPGATLRTDANLELIGQRTLTACTVATPHYGTPLASLATGALGQKLLRTLSVLTLYGLRVGKRPAGGTVARIATLLVRLDDLAGVGAPVLDQLYEQLVAEFPTDSLEEFLGHVRGDQALLPQVTPEGMDLFNASTKDRRGVAYGSVITRAKPPSLRGAWSLGFEPMAQLTHGLYHLLYRIVAKMPERRLRELERSHLDALVRGYGKVPAVRANDGIVPTRSQIWGEIVHIARADHLDVMGYYGDPQAPPRHSDWVASRSGFNRARFVGLWGAVARHIARGD